MTIMTLEEDIALESQISMVTSYTRWIAEMAFQGALAVGRQFLTK